MVELYVIKMHGTGVKMLFTYVAYVETLDCHYRVQSRIFAPRWQKVKQVHKKEVEPLYSPLNVIRMVKLQRM